MRRRGIPHRRVRSLILLVAALAACADLRTTITTPASTPEDYKARMRDVLTLRDVVFLDLDEHCRCVVVGTATAAAAAAARNFAATAGVPSGAIQVVQAKPVAFYASLQGNFRPIEGGVRIQNADRVTCTMMATAYHRGQGKKGLLMNSHCTQSQFAVDNVNVYQPGGTFFSNDYVAKEVIDPAPNASLPGCPTGRRCRLSEAAFAEFDTSTVGIVGKIAKPALRCGNSICDTAINSTAEVLTITGVAATHVVADSREKIGQYSGWTSGRISRTCVDVNVKDTNITLLCQHEVATCGGPGDSGAPVFQRTQGDNVILAGIVWGGPDDGTSFSYSPISAIEAELGTMDFHE